MSDIVKSAGNIGIAATIDLLSTGAPVATMQTTAQEALSIWRGKKAKQARDILLDEITDGNFSNVSDDDKISILHRYLQAAMNGEARINLRILAKLIRGLLNNESLQPALYASEFNRYAKILEGLSHEELQILAALYKFKLQEDAESQMTGIQQGVSDHMADNDPYSVRAMRWLAGKDVFTKQGVGLVEKERGPKILEEDEFQAMIGALTRTGLVSLVSGGFGGSFYTLSPLFSKITKLVDFQEALKKEATK
ncbi:MAG: hypothetical protein FWF24_02670 [Alphaproteobacteria bacterium]|nr:hypothetical protein [Alphaproteobacteria bacterium]